MPDFKTRLAVSVKVRQGVSHELYAMARESREYGSRSFEHHAVRAAKASEIMRLQLFQLIGGKDNETHTSTG